MKEKRAMFWNIAKECGKKSTRITIANNKVLNIDQGKFDGDVEEAARSIQEFCNANTVTYSGMRGYGTLQVNDKKHPITPYGIDLLMMLEFCDIKNESEFTLK